jgi:hypothetical protein
MDWLRKRFWLVEAIVLCLAISAAALTALRGRGLPETIISLLSLPLAISTVALFVMSVLLGIFRKGSFLLGLVGILTATVVGTLFFLP